MIWINAGDRPTWIDIEAVEKRWRERSGGDCRFVASLCTVDRSGNWSERPIEVFWQEKPENPEYSNYFGLFRNGDSMLITNGLPAVKEPFNAVEAASGEVIFSRFRHDYRTSRDGTAMVDGGRDYFKRGGAGRHCILVVDGPTFRVAEMLTTRIDSTS